MGIKKHRGTPPPARPALTNGDEASLKNYLIGQIEARYRELGHARRGKPLSHYSVEDLKTHLDIILKRPEVLGLAKNTSGGRTGAGR
jgi:hypothetical protein